MDDLLVGGPQCEEGDGGIVGWDGPLWGSFDMDFFVCAFVKVTSMRCFRMEGIACLAKSVDFPCITRRDLCFQSKRVGLDIRQRCKYIYNLKFAESRQIF